MHNDYQLIPPLSKKYIKVNLPINILLTLESESTKLGMNTNEYIIYLVEEQSTNDIKTVIKFRYKLLDKLKKGINKNYINQLKKLQSEIDLILNKL